MKIEMPFRGPPGAADTAGEVDDVGGHDVPLRVRAALLRQLGRDRSEAGPYPRRSAEVTYHRPVEFDDEFELRLGVEKAGRSSVTFGWHLVRGEELCVEGRHTVVHVGEDGRPARWPDTLRRGLRLR